MQKIIKQLKRSKKIALFSHTNPDPDTIGSTLALFLALKKIGKDVSLFCDCSLNPNCYFLSGYENYNKDELSQNYDLYVSVDVADAKLLGNLEVPFTSFGNKIKIDHHSSGVDFAPSLVKIYSACAIVVYELIKKMHIKIDKDIATAIYFGICGDTGIFKNINTDALTFKVCAELLTQGAEFKKVYTEFFDKRNVANVKMTSTVLLNAKFNDELNYVIMLVTADDYKKFDIGEDDNLGNLPNTYLNCGYNIGVILKEKSDGIHCSFRSKQGYDCSLIAEKFGGGGHKNASGCKINDTLENAEKKVIKEVENYLKGE